MKACAFARVVLLTLVGTALSRCHKSLQKNDTSNERGLDSGCPRRLRKVRNKRKKPCGRNFRYRAKSGKCLRVRFNRPLPEFGPSVTAPYKSCMELRTDLIIALKKLADVTMDREVKNPHCFRHARKKVAFQSDAVPETASSQASDSGGEDSFETNNQVQGVDEADVVKSDGTYIFMAYGVELVMMNLGGVVIDRVTGKTDDEKSAGNVRGLLLDSDSQTVIAISFDYVGQTYETVAHVYSYSSGGFKEVRSVVIPGRYEDARSIKDKAHIVTATSIGTYTLTSALSRCSIRYRDASDKKYDIKAFKEALRVIKILVQDIFRELGLANGGCSTILRISTMTDSDQNSTETEEDRALDLRGGQSLIENFIRVTSFEMPASDQKGYGSQPFQVEMAGAFIPTSNTELFASEEFIVVAGRGYRRINLGDVTNVWSQYTYLVSFDANGNNGKMSPAAVGSVRGYLLNQFNMDYYNGILRIATTNNERWGYIDGRWEQVSESSSQVSKLEFVDGKMQLVGQVTGLGTTERIFSVRFVRSRGYVVTFRQIDPLFVIDMDPDVPEVLGELKITGFSNFLQPIGENDEYLLGIGQEADENTGRSTGLKISLFDVTNSSNPEEVQNHVVEGFSNSAAQFESKAFRYLPVSKKLIIPVRVYNNGRIGNGDDFDGFMIYDIDTDGIVPSGQVTHADKERITDVGRIFCYSSAHLEPRSLVFKGNMVTLKGHTVKYSKGLNGRKSVWTTNLDEGRDAESDRCYPYFPRPFPIRARTVVEPIA